MGLESLKLNSIKLIKAISNWGYFISVPLCSFFIQSLIVEVGIENLI